MFRLPNYQELSRDQEAVFDLPEEGRYLITGPPGTGKTVLAMMRASVLLQRAHEEADAEPPVFLVYNSVLRQFLQQATQDLGISSTVTTLHSFLPNWYRRVFREEIPLVSNRPEDRFNYNWSNIKHILKTRWEASTSPINQLLIDEGQDFPVAFYQVVDFIADNVTVFADDNQMLRGHGQSATLSDIASTLGITPQATVQLSTNFRNSRQIAEVSANFYAGASGGIPAPPSRVGPQPKLIRYASLEAQAEAILLFERTVPRAYIGVVAETHDTLSILESHFVGETVNPVRRYASGTEQWRLNFRQPGIFLLTYMSVKGLEFDVVFLPAVDGWRNRDPGNVRHMMATFVQTSRPRHDLRVLYTNAAPAIFEQVPATLLARHESSLTGQKVAQ